MKTEKDKNNETLRRKQKKHDFRVKLQPKRHCFHELNIRCCFFYDRKSKERSVKTYKPSIEKKAEEIFVIIEPYTVFYPRTVVVHFQNAFLTSAAVMHSLRFHYFTVLTEIRSLVSCFKFLKSLWVFYIQIILVCKQLYLSRICVRTLIEAIKKERKQKEKNKSSYYSEIPQTI